MTRKKPKQIERSIEKLTRKPDPFTQGDFLNLLDLTMEQQALEHPGLKEITKRLTPEFEGLVRKIHELFQTPDETREGVIFRELISLGEPALLPALEYLLHLKRQGLQPRALRAEE